MSQTVIMPPSQQSHIMDASSDINDFKRKLLRGMNKIYSCSNQLISGTVLGYIDMTLHLRLSLRHSYLPAIRNGTKEAKGKTGSTGRQIGIRGRQKSEAVGKEQEATLVDFLANPFQPNHMHLGIIFRTRLKSRQRALVRVVDLVIGYHSEGMMDCLLLSKVGGREGSRSSGVHVERLALAVVDGDGVRGHAAVFEVVPVPTGHCLIREARDKEETYMWKTCGMLPYELTWGCWRRCIRLWKSRRRNVSVSIPEYIDPTRRREDRECLQLTHSKERRRLSTKLVRSRQVDHLRSPHRLVGGIEVLRVDAPCHGHHGSAAGHSAASYGHSAHSTRRPRSPRTPRRTRLQPPPPEARYLRFVSVALAIAVASSVQPLGILRRKPGIAFLVDHVQQRELAVLGHGLLHQAATVGDVGTDQASVGVLLHRDVGVVAVDLWESTKEGQNVSKLIIGFSLAESRRGQDGRPGKRRRGVKRMRNQSTARSPHLRNIPLIRARILLNHPLINHTPTGLDPLIHITRRHSIRLAEGNIPPGVRDIRIRRPAIGLDVREPHRMHSSVVAAQTVQKHDLHQIPDFAADRGTLGALPGRLLGELREAGVRVAAVQRFEPFGAVGVGAGHVGSGRVGHGYSEPVVPAARRVVPFDFFGGDVVAARRGMGIRHLGLVTKRKRGRWLTGRWRAGGGELLQMEREKMGIATRLTVETERGDVINSKPSSPYLPESRPSLHPTSTPSCISTVTAMLITWLTSRPQRASRLPVGLPRPSKPAPRLVKFRGRSLGTLCDDPAGKISSFGVWEATCKSGMALSEVKLVDHTSASSLLLLLLLLLPLQV
ncbi:hypothetical protein KC345_g329 [Hortaea werneckii]|nr:hypothetical protein KC345_g329 [Hortaea werneckii]